MFTTSSPTIPPDLDDLIEPLVSCEDNEMLTKMHDAIEILNTLKKMAPEKVPEPDGMTVFFFHFFWNVVGPNVVSTIQDFLVMVSCCPL